MRGMVERRPLLHAEQIKAWLAPGCQQGFDADADLQFLLGADLDALPPASRREMAFVLAVLRDIYADDADVLHWLTRQRPEIEGASGVDLLIAGRIQEIEAMLVRHWNQPRKVDGRRLTYVRKVRIT